MEKVTISQEEYTRLEKEVEVKEDLLLKLVRGLADVRKGKLKA